MGAPLTNPSINSQAFWQPIQDMLQPQAPNPMDAALAMPMPNVFNQMLPTLNQAQLHSSGNRYAMGGGLEDANALRGVDAVFANSPLNPEVAARQSARYQQMGRELGGDINQRAAGGRELIEAQKMLQAMQQPNVISNSAGMRLAMDANGRPVGFSTPGVSAQDRANPSDSPAELMAELHRGPVNLPQVDGQFLSPMQATIQGGANAFAQAPAMSPDFIQALQADKMRQPKPTVSIPFPAASARQQQQAPLPFNNASQQMLQQQPAPKKKASRTDRWGNVLPERPGFNLKDSEIKKFLDWLASYMVGPNR